MRLPVSERLRVVCDCVKRQFKLQATRVFVSIIDTRHSAVLPSQAVTMLASASPFSSPGSQAVDVTDEVLGCLVRCLPVSYLPPLMTI